MANDQGPSVPGGPVPGPGDPPPGGAAAPQGPGWYQAADGYWYPGAAEPKSKTGLIIGIVIGVVLLVCLLPTVAILAVTFLGRSASQKFSSVGSAVGLIPALDWPTARLLLRSW
jgi:hypothetical protein